MSHTDHYLMLPTQLVLSITMAGGTLMRIDGAGASDGTAAMVLLACIPVLLVLFYAICFPDKVDRLCETNPSACPM